MNKIIYVAELDADVDDVIAAEYLHKHGFLSEVVCDPLPKTDTGKERAQELMKLGIKVSKKMPPVADVVFVGGALTEVARYVLTHKIKTLVMNGGFVGCNIMTNPLPKFKNKETVRTFNFNCDVAAADKVLKSSNIEQIILVGKNVCHDERNTLNGIWQSEADILNKYHARPDKRQHDMLACREGLIQLGMLNEASYLFFESVYPFNTGLNENMTQWGSTYKKTEYRNVLAAVGWNE